MDKKQARVADRRAKAADRRAKASKTGGKMPGVTMNKGNKDSAKNNPVGR